MLISRDETPEELESDLISAYVFYNFISGLNKDIKEFIRSISLNDEENNLVDSLYEKFHISIKDNIASELSSSGAIGIEEIEKDKEHYVGVQISDFDKQFSQSGRKFRVEQKKFRFTLSDSDKTPISSSVLADRCPNLLLYIDEKKCTITVTRRRGIETEKIDIDCWVKIFLHQVELKIKHYHVDFIDNLADEFRKELLRLIEDYKSYNNNKLKLFIEQTITEEKMRRKGENR